MAGGGQNTPFFPLGGGLDLVTPAIAVKPGRVLSSLNYEPAPAGYRRMVGYERFDGRPAPSSSATPETERAAITAVPGSGPVRGVLMFKNDVYAVRDNADATAGAMWRASPTGWTAIPLGRTLTFNTGGAYEIKVGDVVTGATSGAKATVRRVVLQSGSWAGGTAAGYLVTSDQTGAFVAESLNVGTTLNVAKVPDAGSAVTIPAGGRYEYIQHNFYANANTNSLYVVNGVGRPFEFDGTTVAPINTGHPLFPHRIAVHRNHLVFGYPGGEVNGSQPGEPFLYNGANGAWTFGIGDEITDFISANATVLTILGRNGVFNLIGNDTADFELQALSNEAGALPWTAEMMGTAIYMDNRGVRSIASTQSYGNFTLGTMTQDVHPLVLALRKAGVQPVASCRVRAKDQYRVFFDDRRVLVMYLGKRNPEITICDFGLDVTCIVSAETLEGQEKIYAGSVNGFVYQLERGNSLDGAAMPYYLRLPFNHLGAPQYLKRFHKVVVECEAGSNATLRVSSEFDYSSSDAAAGTVERGFLVQGGGSYWDQGNWDEFSWDGPVAGTAECYLDGVGRNISLLIAGATSDEEPHTLQGISLFFTMRGLQR